MTGLVTNDREALREAVRGARHGRVTIGDYLIDSGVVRVLDPDNDELVDRVAKVLAPATFMDDPPPNLDRFGLSREGWRDRARAVIEALRQP